MKITRFLVLITFAAALSAQPLPTYQVVHAFGQPNNGAGGPAPDATVIRPQRITGDEDGNVYVPVGNRVYKIDAASGIYSLVAGNGSPLSSGNDGPATEAGFGEVRGLAARDGFLYIVQARPCNIRRVDLDTGIITNAVGTGFCATPQGPIAGNAATIQLPGGFYLAFDPEGRLLYGGGTLILRIDLGSGDIETIAGTGVAGDSGDGGPATAAQFTAIAGLAVDPAGNIYVADFLAQKIRKIDAASGEISTIAGTGTAGDTGDGGPAADAQINSPGGIGLNPDGTRLYFGYQGIARVVDLSTGIIVRFAGGGAQVGGGVPRFERIFFDVGYNFWVNANDEAFFSDRALNEVVKIGADGVVQQVAGRRTFSGDGGPAQKAQITPRDVLVTPGGRILISDGVINRRIREVAGGVMTTAAGVGFTQMSTGDGGPATAAGFTPNRLAADAQGFIYLTDTLQMRPRHITPENIIQSVGTTVAGATAGIAANRAGDLLYVSHSGQRRVHVENFVDLATTFAGLGNVGEPGGAGFSGDGGPADMAELGSPQGMAVDDDGNLYICDLSNHRVRKVDAATGVISTIAGNGQPVFTGPATGPATDVAVGFVFDCAVDSEQNVFFTGGDETGTSGVWRLDNASNQVHLIAGGPDAEVPITRPYAIDVDSRGVVYVADEDNGRILALIPDNLEGPYITGVITPGAFGAGDKLASGGWVEVFGFNLASDTGDWSESFDGDMAPTSLNGASLLVNGDMSAISYASPGQVNGQAPDGALTENSTIQIVTDNGASNVFALTARGRAGTLLAPPAFAAGDKQYVVALFDDGAYVGPPGLIAGANFRRAVAGDVVVMYGVGFGGVEPPVPAGTIASGATALPNVTVRIGGQEARVVYAGLSPGSVGLYQFNIEIPEGVSGDVLLEVTVDGVTVEQVLCLSVE